jgi:hypothetical protein
MYKHEIEFDLLELNKFFIEWINFYKKNKLTNENKPINEDVNEDVNLLEELSELVKDKCNNYVSELDDDVDYPNFLLTTGAIRLDLSNFLRKIPKTQNERNQHVLDNKTDFLKGINDHIDEYVKELNKFIEDSKKPAHDACKTEDEEFPEFVFLSRP